MQVRGVWHLVNTHSADWMYFTFTEPCPGPYSPMGVVTADAFSPGEYPWDYDQDNAFQWLALSRRDKVPAGNMYVPKTSTQLRKISKIEAKSLFPLFCRAIPIHGTPKNSTELYAALGYEYPDYKTTDFIPGGPWC